MRDSLRQASQTLPEPTADQPNEVPKIVPNGDLAQSHYKFNYLVFPSDIGMDDMGHYMVININVPTKLSSDAIAGDFENQVTPIEPRQRSKVDTLRFGPVGSGTPLIPGGKNPTGGRQSPLLTVPRATRRIQESIALFMPTPLTFVHQNAYEEISLTALGGRVGVAAGNFLGGLIPSKAAQSLIGGVAASIGSAAGGVIAEGMQIAQTPINPAVEVLFSTTAVRQFTMEVLMAPKSEHESESMKAIIKTLRFHGSPELNSITKGMTWIPPAEFDITFFNRGVENLNILRMNTCVLERCEVDYAPTSGIYSTFRNGHPVAVRLQLGFKEIEPLHKLRILQGF